MNVIKHPQILRSNYIPKKLLFRENLIQDIKLKLKIGTGNILIHGDTGSGKTASVRNALDETESITIIFINCVQDNTFAAIAKKVIEIIRDKDYNERGKNRSLLSEDLIKTLKTKRTKKLVFVFDEIDKLINKDRDHQQILNPILESTDSNIILISNEIDALRNLDSRLESRLSPEKKFVPQYFTNEIFEILKQRAEEGLFQESYDLEVLAHLSKHIFQTSGDIREALNLFYEVCNLAEKTNSRIVMSLLEEAKSRVDELEFDEIFAGLPLHQKIITAGIAKLSSDEAEGYAEHKKLYDFYEKTAENEASQPQQAAGYRLMVELI
ncbi:AAA family ATPase [Candidatus Woesearchaeota archaeon]|nr:AAA family ATPase [Candidatus Woesearchaeota archaeon]